VKEALELALTPSSLAVLHYGSSKGSSPFARCDTNASESAEDLSKSWRVDSIYLFEKERDFGGAGFESHQI